MSSRKSPPLSTIKALFAKSLNRCAFPGCHRPIVDDETSTVVGEICHIEGIGKKAARYNPNRPPETLNNISNLMLLCGEHHSLVDDKRNDYTVAVLRQMKNRHEAQGRLEITPEDALHAQALLEASKAKTSLPRATYLASNIFNASGSARQNIVFNHYGPKKQPDVIPDDAIAHNSQKSGYIQHLIDRYKEFDGNLTHNKRLSGIKISNEIRKKFGRGAKFVSTSFFQSLVQFLQWKIDNTIPGRGNTRRGIKNYSSFEDWIVSRGEKR